MNDMSGVIEPKSDQLNADDMISGPMTVTIRDVKITPGTEQPVSIILSETDKFYRPCKSMSRVLVGAWGADAKAYLGRALTLYRDPEVKWGGMAVGGIRISHMSHIDGAKVMVLTATKGSRKPHKVMPLVLEPSKDDAATKWAGGYIANLAKFTTLAELQAFTGSKAAKLNELKGARPDLFDQVGAAVEQRIAALGSSGFDDDADVFTPHPASAIADKLIGAVQSAQTIADLTAIEKGAELDIAAMPDEMAATVQGAFETARARLKEPAQ